MKISYLELLEMIRDGKAPKKIKVCGFDCINFDLCVPVETYEWNGSYYENAEPCREILNMNSFISHMKELVTKKCIEIIEEECKQEPEFKEIEKLNIKKDLYPYEINTRENYFETKINELIDNQNLIIKKLDKEV